MRDEQARIEAIKKSKQFRPSLCWECVHAVPDDQLGYGCSWSREQKPVDGWKAVKTNVEEDSYYPPDRPVFHVMYCPKFHRVMKSKPMMSAQEKNVRGLALAVIKRATDDLEELYTDYYKKKQWNVTRKAICGNPRMFRSIYGHITSDDEFDFIARRIKSIRKDMMGEWMNSISGIDCKALYYDVLKKVRKNAQIPHKKTV